MSSKNPVSVSSIKGMFAGAVQNGEVSSNAANIMVNSLNDTNILGCTGVDVEDLDTDSVTLSAIFLDDSYSMKSNEQVVRESYDELLIEALKGSKQASSMLNSAWVFSTDYRILYEFKKVTDIGKIGSQYRAEGNSTRIYDTLVPGITGIRAYAKTLNDSGIQTKCMIILVTDGHDNDSQQFSAKDVKTLVDDCIASEMFYPAYVGFKSDPSDDHDAAAKAIGFPSVLTSSNNKSDVRKALGLVSQSIIRKSQTQIGPANSFFQ